MDIHVVMVVRRALRQRNARRRKTHQAFDGTLIDEIGYDNAAKLAKSAHARSTPLKEEALRLGFVRPAEFDRLVRPDKMTHPG